MILDLVAVAVDFALDLGGGLSLPAMAILFTVGGALAGYFTGLKGKALFKSFVQGAKTIAPVIPVIVNTHVTSVVPLPVTVNVFCSPTFTVIDPLFK